MRFETPKRLKESIVANLEFPEGWRIKTKKPSMGVWTFSRTTQQQFLSAIY